MGFRAYTTNQLIEQQQRASMQQMEKECVNHVSGPTLNYKMEYEQLELQCKVYEEQIKDRDNTIEQLKQTIKTLAKLI